MTQNVQVQVGDKLFESEDGRAFGAVMEVHAHELLVDIEGSGPTTLAASAVRAVHDAKVIVDVPQLSRELQERIAHAHDRETLY
ncbi:MAG: hypothetical protein JWN04_6930 [Myxococcaceae bacterium]|nr:hypothetical protein [Myxococcaceae bacterium]